MIKRILNNVSNSINVFHNIFYIYTSLSTHSLSHFIITNHINRFLVIDKESVDPPFSYTTINSFLLFLYIHFLSLLPFPSTLSFPFLLSSSTPSFNESISIGNRFVDIKKNRKQLSIDVFYTCYRILNNGQYIHKLISSSIHHRIL